ncbi:MAG: ABC transporter substrate-binding protein [Coriobacteriia bacterium]|nr:ABC transporter substrate-binding protein [Coriobacteriia bacterium]
MSWLKVAGRGKLIAIGLVVCAAVLGVGFVCNGLLAKGDSEGAAPRVVFAGKNGASFDASGNPIASGSAVTSGSAVASKSAGVSGSGSRGGAGSWSNTAAGGGSQGSSGKSGDAASPTKVVTDDDGRVVRVPSQPQRIICMDTASTEILFACGAGSRVVGRADNLTYPPEALSLPSLGSMGTPSLEKMVSLKPDLVTISGSTTFRRWVPEAERAGLTVLSYNYPLSIEGIFDMMQRIGDMAGVGDGARTLAADCRAEYNRITAITNKLSTNQKPTVGIVYFGTSKMYTWGDVAREGALLQAAGGRNIFPSSMAMGTVAPESFVAQNPDIIIGLVTPGTMTDADAKAATIQKIKTQTGWQNINAVKNNRVYAIIWSECWAGPRIKLGMDSFFSAIHPELN